MSKQSPPRHRNESYLDYPVHIAASPYKTGTTSLGEALISLGIGKRDMGYNPVLLQDYKKKFRKFSKDADEAVDARAYIDARGSAIRRAFSGFTEQLKPFDVFSDAPFGHTHIHPFIKKLLAPSSKFIWINREFGSWIKSVRTWEVSHPATYRNWRDWERDPEGRTSLLKERWNKHHDRFKALAEAFPDDCLELELEALDDFAAVCAFYDIPNPGGAFPKRNIAQTP